MTHARNLAIGRYGEAIAAHHLRELGWVILDRNWTSRYGEIDIVAREGDTLVICEVKTRTGRSRGSSLESIHPAKAVRLRRLAAAWLDAHRIDPPSLRIDLVAVQVPAKGTPEITRVTGVA